MKQKYNCIADMEDDLTLLCTNARTFNEEGSQVRQIELRTFCVLICFVVLLNCFFNYFANLSLSFVFSSSSYCPEGVQ